MYSTKYYISRLLAQYWYNYSENLSFKIFKCLCNSVEISTNFLRMIVNLLTLPCCFVFKNNNIIILINAKKMFWNLISMQWCWNVCGENFVNILRWKYFCTHLIQVFISLFNTFNATLNKNLNKYSLFIFGYFFVKMASNCNYKLIKIYSLNQSSGFHNIAYIVLALL